MEAKVMTSHYIIIEKHDLFSIIHENIECVKAK